MNSESSARPAILTHNPWQREALNMKPGDPLLDIRTSELEKDMVRHHLTFYDKIYRRKR